MNSSLRILVRLHDRLAKDTHEALRSLAQRAAPISASPATSPAATQDVGAADAEHFIVPAGHEVRTYGMMLHSSVEACAGGIWLAHVTGSMGSDEPEHGLAMILAEVDELMRGPRPRVFVSHASGSFSSLMAPNDPEVIEYPGVLVWTVDAALLAGAPGAPSLVQRWLRCIYTIGTRGTPPLQVVFLRETASPRARAVAALVRGLPLEVRTPDARNGAIVAEVHRPEGLILSALLGAHQAPVDP